MTIVILILHCGTQRVACDKNLFRRRKRRLSTIETKRDGGFFWNYCDNFNNSSSILFKRVTVNVLVFVLRVVFFHTMLCVGILHYQQVLCESVLMAARSREEKVMSWLYRRKIVLWRK